MGRTDLRPDITKEVLEEYIRKGYSQNRIAITLGTTQSTIFNKLKKYGLQVQKTRPSNYDEKALIKQLQNGWTTEQIARYFGVCTGTVGSWISKNKLGKYRKASPKKFDTFEVSYHVGARPTHQPWQGKVWTRQELVSVCGLGEVTGLKGANCYHDYKPFPPGSVRTYTDEQLQEILEAENTPKEYNGKQYTTYEALQQQRKMERAMRAQRQKIKLLEEGEADKQDIILAKAKYQGQMQTYKDFSKKMHLPEQKARIMQDGLKGKFMPTKAEQKILEESVINDKIKTELSEAKIKGIPKINPDKIDVSKFTFDNSHINAVREHGVTRAEAEQFIKESDISLTRWNGRFITVTDGKESSPAVYEGARINVDGAILVTGDDGKAEFNLRAGTYTAKITKKGYISVTETFTVAKTAVTKNITLTSLE